MTNSGFELYFPEMSNDTIDKNLQSPPKEEPPGLGNLFPPDRIIRPEDVTYTPRGTCGKKNCRTNTRFLGIPFPLELNLGGSGVPRIDDTKSLTDNSELEWSYNNLVTYNRSFGWVIIRLQRSQPSLALLGKIQVNGEDKLTAIKQVLNLTVLIPRFRFKYDVPEPLVLTLQQIISERHFQFLQDSSSALIKGLGIPITSVDRPEIDVTPSSVYSLAIREIQYSNSPPLLSFRIELGASVEDIVQPLAWFVHNPEETGDWIPVGNATFNGVSSEKIEVDLSPYPNLNNANRLIIEAVTLRDPRHLWTFAILNL